MTLMKISSRRAFLGMMTVVAPLASLLKSNAIFAQKKGMFIHHVYFWLKNSGNKEDKAKLIEGLKKLSKVKTIKNFYIGQAAATRRDVIDSSYDISWLLFFDSAANQDSYQTDPIHLKFIEECSSLWTKVVVYDTIDATP
jgi:Stress responsive A/B Barrel Domain